MKTVSKKRFVIVISILTVICILTVGAAALLVGSFYGKYSKLMEIDRIVREDYYGEIDEQDLSDALCEGYIDGINDKYSYYKNNEETEEKSLDTNGETVGIGVYVTLNPNNNNIVVTNVMDASPAKEADIKRLDEIVAVGEERLADFKYSDAIELLRANVGDTINITISRDGKEIKKELVCKQFTTQNVYYRMIDGIGYVRIISFDRVTFEQFNIAVDDLIEQGAKGLIFDVQDNAGGTFDAMSEMLDKLVGKGHLITLKYGNGDTKKTAYSDSNEINLPMAVLVNSSSASASELFAATLRDYDKAVLIGEKTYGKCVMQRSYLLKDKTSIRITVANCLTKSGYDFNGKGLEPDIKISLNEQQQAYYYRLSDNENPLITAAVDWIKENG